MTIKQKITENGYDKKMLLLQDCFAFENIYK